MIVPENLARSAKFMRQLWDLNTKPGLEPQIPSLTISSGQIEDILVLFPVTPRTAPPNPPLFSFQLISNTTNHVRQPGLY